MQPSTVPRKDSGVSGNGKPAARLHAPGPITGPPVSPKRILVVDDVPHVAQAIEALLAASGHEVETVPGGREALAKFKRGKYDLIITDYAMPKMTGVKLAQTLRGQAPQQRILLVTAFSFSLAGQENEPVPVDMILQKPFSPHELQHAIAALFPA